MQIGCWMCFRGMLCWSGPEEVHLFSPNFWNLSTASIPRSRLSCLRDTGSFQPQLARELLPLRRRTRMQWDDRGSGQFNSRHSSWSKMSSKITLSWISIAISFSLQTYNLSLQWLYIKFKRIKISEVCKVYTQLQYFIDVNNFKWSYIKATKGSVFLCLSMNKIYLLQQFNEI